MASNRLWVTYEVQDKDGDVYVGCCSTAEQAEELFNPNDYDAGYAPYVVVKITETKLVEQVKVLEADHG